MDAELAAAIRDGRLPAQPSPATIATIADLVAAGMRPRPAIAASRASQRRQDGPGELVGQTR
jgi:hypothetical protein